MAEPSAPDGVSIPRATPLPDDVADRLDAKERMVVTAARLFQREGYHATGIKRVAAEARAPRGSIYHHFPGGKEDLGVLAIRAAGAELTRAIRVAAERSTGPGDVVRRIGRALARWLEASDYLEGCPVATVALETTPRSAPLTEACRDAYRAWIDQVVELLRARGVAEEVAGPLATTTIAALEGALLLCRTEQSTAPMRQVSESIADLVADAVGRASS